MAGTSRMTCRTGPWAQCKRPPATLVCSEAFVDADLARLELKADEGLAAAWQKATSFHTRKLVVTLAVVLLLIGPLEMVVRVGRIDDLKLFEYFVSDAHTVELDYFGVRVKTETGRGPCRPWQFGVAPARSDVVRLVQLKVAVGQQAAALHRYYVADLALVCVGYLANDARLVLVGVER
ncbi:hypothetical protein BpHYR1_042916 [Brachionus plicatilis]|uniref:Uncharacterized protein n=1 Tax=Brachionus plicatilis TaxID=10195 RepID=A0A3M7S844_BRAPC|nr:hypothetical protein BpHYR1_042916 [Brachionus plicatilis]